MEKNVLNLSFQKTKEVAPGMEEKVAGNKLVEERTVLPDGSQRRHRKGMFADSIFDVFATTTGLRLRSAPDMQVLPDWRMQEPLSLLISPQSTAGPSRGQCNGNNMFSTNDAFTLHVQGLCQPSMRRASGRRAQ